MAQTILLNHVPIPTQNIHPINCSGNPQISVKEYDDFLHSYFPIDAPNFDLVLLGLGADGHIASVFPNNLKESEESKKWVTSVKIPGNEVQRVTFTIPFINHANSVFILVSGKEKAPILKRVLGNPKENDYLPALLIKPESQELHWMIDEPAAALLDRTSININYF
jgi:6-phosphogluconolactonase